MATAVVHHTAPTTHTAAQTTAAPAAAGYCVVPQCTLTVEKTKTGCKLHCKCDDELSAATLQQMCKILANNCCTCCCTFNGVKMLECALVCCHCSCEATADGCCITCETGDKACCEAVQACCAAIACCIESGCCCTICFGNTPVCCCC